MKGVKATSWISDLIPGDGDSRHGLNGYSNLGCRCEICRSAKRKQQKALRETLAGRLARGEVDPPHGTESTYLNYSCRCPACVNAHRVADAARRARRKARAAP